MGLKKQTISVNQPSTNVAPLCCLTALILEEIAIDNTDKEAEKRLLQEALDLHVSALRLSCQAFGEMNVQTAKHYGNLGRLYQSMRRFQASISMLGTILFQCQQGCPCTTLTFLGCWWLCATGLVTYDSILRSTTKTEWIWSDLFYNCFYFLLWKHVLHLFSSYSIVAQGSMSI